MADLILGVYSGGGRGLILNTDDVNSSDAHGDSGGDLFHQLARQSSTCPHTRDDGGEIGWVDNPYYKRDDADVYREEDQRINEAISDIVSPDVISALFRHHVKGGDVIKLPITTTNINYDGHNASEGHVTGWHILRVDDLHLRPITAASTSDNIINKVRPKLKGSGVAPLSPSFHKLTDSTTEATATATASSATTTSVEDKHEESQNNVIYTVPNAKYYKIITTGCQMNVADSERITGVLEEELGLSSLEDERDGATLITGDVTNNKKSEKRMPHVLLLNTCTIRDHAEQKVYDALGPYAALKRAGKPIAIVVAGCVAQQEGEL